MALLRMGKKTSESKEAVLKKAVVFFGVGGTGLQLVQQSDNLVRLTGGGGHVQVEVTPLADGRSEIDIQTRDWEHDVKRFLEKI